MCCDAHAATAKKTGFVLIFQKKFLNDPLVVASDVYRRAAYGRNHPLAIPRVETALDIAADLHWLQGRVRPSPVAGCDLLTRFHTSAWVEALARADAEGIVSPEVRARHGLGGHGMPDRLSPLIRPRRHPGRRRRDRGSDGLGGRSPVHAGP